MTVPSHAGSIGSTKDGLEGNASEQNEGGERMHDGLCKDGAVAVQQITDAMPKSVHHRLYRQSPLGSATLIVDLMHVITAVQHAWPYGT